MRRWMYDAMYRVWAPWDAVGVRDDLRSRVGRFGRAPPIPYGDPADLGRWTSCAT